MEKRLGIEVPQREKISRLMAIKALEAAPVAGDPKRGPESVLGDSPTDVGD